MSRPSVLCEGSSRRRGLVPDPDQALVLTRIWRIVEMAGKLSAVPCAGTESQRCRLWLRLGLDGAGRARRTFQDARRTFQDARCHLPQTRHRYGRCPLLCRLADALSWNVRLSAQISSASLRRASSASFLYLSAIRQGRGQGGVQVSESRTASKWDNSPVHKRLT